MTLLGTGSCVAAEQTTVVQRKSCAFIINVDILASSTIGECIVAAGELGLIQRELTPDVPAVPL